MPLIVDGKVYALDMIRTNHILDLGVLDAVTRGIPVETELLLKEEDKVDSNLTVVQIV